MQWASGLARGEDSGYELKVNMADELISDCVLLLSRFERLQSVRFERFCELWEDLNFSLVLCGGRDNIGRTQIVEYLYYIISTYLSSSYSFQYRIGALYSLYAVYYVQLAQPKVKIRLTLSRWNELKELHQKIKEEQHHDADFILRFMVNDRAFLFVAMPVPLALMGPRDASVVVPDGGKMASIADDADITVQEVYSSAERLDEIHGRYQQMKEAVNNSINIASERSLNVIPSDLPSEIQSEAGKFDEWKDKRCHKHVLDRKSSRFSVQKVDAHEDLTSDGNTSEGSSQEARSRPRRITEIKKKSFTTVTKVSRSMRHLQPTAAPNNEPAKKKGKK